MAGNDAGPAGRQVAFGQVEVGAAHAAYPHGKQDLARPGAWIGSFAEHQGMPCHGTRLANPPRTHGTLPVLLFRRGSHRVISTLHRARSNAEETVLPGWPSR